MKEYELAVVLHPDLEIDQDKALAKIDKQLSELKAKVVSLDDWGKRKLAYPIAKQQYGLYFFYRLELDPQTLAELERGLQISNEVMRYLVVKYETPPATVTKPEAGETKAVPEEVRPKKPAKAVTKKEEE